PTGVGKTELARALAEFLFDDEQALVRIDMSEYMEKFAVSRLLGAPPGYVGYEEGGQLTETVRRRPYQVVLFDEIEKAHPDVFNALTDEQLAKIVGLLLAGVRRRLEEAQINVEITDAAMALVAKEGYDPTYGARPLRRAIQREIENPLARRILGGDFVSGDTLRIDARERQIVFEKSSSETPSKPAPPAEPAAAPA